MYRLLESETCLLADYKNQTLDLYQLIKKKESRFGNLFTDKYHKLEHKSELYTLRAEILKKCEEYRKRKNNIGEKDLLWRGVPYAEICRMEKIDVELRMKEEIREEIQ